MRLDCRVNTKVTGHTPLDAIQKLAPPDIWRELAERIRSHRYYASGSNAIVMQSEEHRKQSENRKEVIRKRNSVLQELLVQIITKQAHKGPPKRL